MAQVLQPKVTGDATQDSWSFEVTNQTNSLTRRVDSLEDEVVLTSPNGTRYRLTVSNTGTLSAVTV